MVSKNYRPRRRGIYHVATVPRTKLAMTLGTMSLALSLACGGGGGSSLSIEDFCAEEGGAFTQFVDKLVECTPEFEIFLGELPTSASVAAACSAQFAPFIGDGTVEFGEKAQLDACIAAILAADCETMEIDNILECEEIVIGQVELGDSCETNDQCAGEAFCAAPVSGETCGVCTAALADGVSCEDNSDCLSAKCRSNGACGPFAEEGDTCDDTEDCVGRLVCDGGTCAPESAVTVGDTCGTEFTDCGFPLSGLYCAADMTCTEFLAPGDDCIDGTVPLGSCNLLNYETCDTMGTRKCIAPTLVKVGEQCDFAGGLKCEPGLLCEGGQSGRCAATGDGTACNVNAENNTCGLFLECKENNVCGYEDEYTGMCPAA